MPGGLQKKPGKGAKAVEPKVQPGKKKKRMAKKPTAKY